MIKLTINDVQGEFKEGSTLLECIQGLGLTVPTLCHHKALTPYGSCRLCLVEVQEDGGDPKVQASCSYQAQDGLKILTNSPRVLAARKIMSELLLARCPESETIQRIAMEHGVQEPRISKKNDDCIYCGLCERMCQERMGRFSLGFSGRGPEKQVEPPFGAHNELCWTCGACDFICPVGKKISTLSTDKTPIPLPNPYNMGLDEKPAIHILYPQAVPNTPVIDRDKCIHLNYDDCRICEEVCEARAIAYDQEEETIKLDVGAVILAPGFEVFDPSVNEELGYGRFPNVITSLEFERVLSASGPYSGEVLRPFDRKKPERIAFLQCIGSRDTDHDYCSSVCCMYATKEALIAKEHMGGDLECDIFFMDIRAFSKGFDEYYQRAKEQGVNYIRCRVAEIDEIDGSRNLRIEYLTEDDRKATAEYDLVVLSVGMLAPESAEEIAETFGIELNEHGFCKTSVFNPVSTSREGILVSGPFSEPKDIPETVMQASGAAANVMSMLNEAQGSLITPREYPPEKDVTGEDPRVGVFICHCGTNIAGVVNVPDVVEYARSLQDVVFVENNLYTCSNDTQELIKEKIEEHELNRVVVASCTPRTHEPLFRSTIREAGLNPYLFEMANIRDQCSWVHMFEPDKATEKSRDLVRMAVAKARLLEPLEERSLPVTKAALVIGGGLAGMTSALELAQQKYDVHLVEQEQELGGHLRQIHYLLNGEEPQQELEKVIKRVQDNEHIHLYTESTIDTIAGSIGNFKTTIETKGATQEFDHGIVIVATGAQPYKPEEYLYGEDEGVITQVELERRLATNGDWFSLEQKQAPRTVVMIQCVGSRDEERPYCSRLCCTEAVKNALKIKSVSPETNVYILYRDIRTYGFRESYYTKARQEGVVFVRYDSDDKPEVSRNGSGLEIEVLDKTLGDRIGINADLLVLSAGLIPGEGNESIGKFLKVPLDSNGFFLEAHMKLRPVDFATEGVFLAGLAHSSKAIDESVIQAQAAASRGATVLSKEFLDLEANISEVIDANCDGCAYCVEPCPFSAITLIEFMQQGAIKKVVEVNDSACKGCGGCQATCPKQGIIVSGFKLEQISAQVNAVLGG